MSLHRQRTLIRRLSLAAGLVWGALAGADPLIVSELEALPGDDVVGLSIEDQRRPVIAAGGPGALVVWEDTRTVLTGPTQTPFEPLKGNLQDVVAARVDGDGHLLDTAPILVGNLGRNQGMPEVAWSQGAGAWLVVWTSERPDWHFFEDLVAARVAADGSLLDPTPIPLRLERNDPAGDLGQMPAVASNGDEWLVVWQDVAWDGFEGRPNVTGLRIGTDGVPIGSPVVLYQHPDVAFGPREPRIAFSDGVYLATWLEAGSNQVRGARFDASLTPLDGAPTTIASGFWARTAGSDDGFMVVTSDHRAYRVTTAGQVLDPGGIDVLAGYPFGISGPEVVFDGIDWAVSYAAADTMHFQDDPDLYLARIGTDGSVQSPGPQPVLAADQWEVTPALAAGAQPGSLQLAFGSYHPWQPRLDDVRAMTVDVTGAAGEIEDLGVGLPRQWAVRAATAADGHLAVFLSQASGVTRILARRLADDGSPVDPEPVEVAVLSEDVAPHPDVAFDGAVHLVVWAVDGTVWGRRLSPTGIPVDPQPVALVDGDNAQSACVGAVPGTFLVGWIRLFSGDLQTFKARPFAAADLAVAGPESVVGGNFSTRARIAALGGRFLTLWQRQPTHDMGPSEAYAAFVGVDGSAGAGFSVDGAGAATDVELAVGPDRALALWSDGVGHDGLAVEGRLIGADGALPGGEVVIAEAANDQRFPAAAWDGANFVVAWTDFRSVEVSLTAVEQLRGDIWARRLGDDGTSPDTAAYQLTSGVLPETLPAVVSTAGMSTVLFSQLAGVGGPEVQRLHQRRLTDPGVAGAGELLADGFESGGLGAWSSISP